VRAGLGIVPAGLGSMRAGTGIVTAGIGTVRAGIGIEPVGRMSMCTGLIPMDSIYSFWVIFMI